MSNYIDYRFKRSLIMRLCLGMLMISFASGWLLFLILPGETTKRFYYFLIHSFYETDEHMLSLVVFIGLVDILLAVFFTLLLALFLSHKIGGPIFKLEQHIKRLRRGDLRRAKMSLRANDQGQILAEAFNAMLQSWHMHISELKYCYCKFSARLSGLEKDCLPSEGADNPDDANAVMRAKRDAEKIQEVLDRYIV